VTSHVCSDAVPTDNSVPTKLKHIFCSNKTSNEGLSGELSERVYS